MRYWVGLVVAISVSVAGCSETTGTGGGVAGHGGAGGTAGSGGTGGLSGFDPSGCDVHVRGCWLIDGETPNEDTCDNIALVELAIIDSLEQQFWVPAEFSLRCDAENDPNAVIIEGAACIDTRIVTRDRCGGSGEILRNPPSEEYKSRWRGMTDLKFVVDCSPIEVDQVTPIDGGAQLILDVGTVNLRTGPAGPSCSTP